MSAPVPAIETRSAPVTKTDANPSKRSTIGRIALWLGGIVLVCLVIGLAILTWAWTQRYALIERQAIVHLQSLGIEADLSIRSMTGTQADIRNIRLAYDGEPFLRVDRLNADYQWRNLLEGEVEKLVFTGLDATVTVNERGEITDGWRPPATGDQATSLPREGIVVKNGSITIETPFGTLPVSGSGDIRTIRDFDLQGTIRQSHLQHEQTRLTVAGPFSIQGPDRLDPNAQKVSHYQVTLPALDMSLSHPMGELLKARLTVDGYVDPETETVSGRSTLSRGQFDLAGITGRIDHIHLDGQNVGLTEQDLNMSIALQDVAVAASDRRNDLARQFSLSDAMNGVPIASAFVPELTTVFSDLLDGSTIAGRLRLRNAPEKRDITLQDDLRVENGEIVAIFSPRDQQPLYDFTQTERRIRIATHVALNRPVPLRLEALDLSIRSEDGLGVQSLEKATGTLASRATWATRTTDGKPARLRPLRVAFEYEGREEGPARFHASGRADYDGNIPGGHVTGLKAGGDLTVRLTPGRPQMSFAPNRPIAISRLESTSDWDIVDFEGELVPTRLLYQRHSDENAAIMAALNNARFAMNRKEMEGLPAASLRVAVSHADLRGDIGTSTQDWMIDFKTVQIASDTYPVDDIRAQLSDGRLRAELREDGRTRLDLVSPVTQIDTPDYTIRTMSLDLDGTLEAYALDFDAGSIALNTGTFPALPARGSVTFADGIFTGTARTQLPKTTDQPVSVDFTFQDGVGQAKVTVRDLTFRPRGLQPQDLAPALRGKIAAVEGVIHSDLVINIAPDRPLSGSGVIDIVNLSLGTAPGPITGLSGQVELSSLFPVTTPPSQSLRMERFDPGIPLDRGEFRYALVEGGVDIETAYWPLGDGQITLDPTLWLYAAKSNRVTLRVDDVDIGDMIGNAAGERLSVTGIVSGEIPIVVEGINVEVDRGRIEVRDGGTIQYRPRPGEDFTSALDNPNAAQAFKALENFHYESLFAEIDGPLDGAVMLGMNFTGSNEDVLYNVPFAFDISVEGELFNIARSLNPNALRNQFILRAEPVTDPSGQEGP